MSGPYIPGYIVSTKKLTIQNGMVAIGDLISKGWTPGMIEALGEPTRGKSGRAIWYPQESVEKFVKSSGFYAAVAAHLKKKLTGEYNSDVLPEACLVLHSVNIHLKRRAYKSNESRKAYENKAFLLRYLYINGFVQQVAYSQSVALFALLVEIGGEKFLWHAPLREVNYLGVADCKPFDPPLALPAREVAYRDCLEALDLLEQLCLRLLISDLEKASS